MYYPTDKSYFAGFGGKDQGFSNVGIKVIQSLEYDANCVENLKANFDHDIISADIRDTLVLSQVRSDIMSFTYPCTRYSTIADIHGTRTGDDLFLHSFRHIAIERPEAYWVENVPGMLKFPVVMEAMTKLPGYYVNVFCPVDANVWLPQHRRRLILIGTRKPFNFRAPTPPKRRIRLRDIVERNVHINVPPSVISRIKGKYRDKPIISDPRKDDLAPCCVAHYSKDVSTRLLADKSYRYGVRPYTVREYARLQGFPDSFKFIGTDPQAYKGIGNAVAVPVAEWGGKELLRYFNRNNR
jgi:DNA (cytosine-5)-methyltransferase 1